MFEQKEATVSAIVQVLEANEKYARGFKQLATRLERETGKSPVVPGRFLTVTDLEDNVRKQIRKVRSHPSVERLVDDHDVSPPRAGRHHVGHPAG